MNGFVQGGEMRPSGNAKVYVYGSSGFAREVACLVEQSIVGGVSGRRVEGLLDDDPALWGANFGALRVLGGKQFLLGLGEDVEVVFGFSAPKDKAVLFDSLASCGRITFPCVIHPTALLAPTARLGAGVIMFPWVAVWNEVNIGDACLLCTSTHIGHESRIGSFSSFYPKANISGKVEIGQAVTVGVNATVLPGLRISHDAIVGAAANVTHDVPAGAIVIGNPAREVKSGD